MNKRVYLSGRYQGCNEKEASEWRKKVERLLGEDHVHIPIRKTGYDGMTHDECVELVNNDLNMIDECCAVLYNAWSPSWGSGCELRYAFEKGLVTVVFGTGSISPWLRAHATHYVSTLEEAVEWLKGRYGWETKKGGAIEDFKWMADNRYILSGSIECRK